MWKMFWWCKVIAVIGLLYSINVGNCSRILAICPRASISHQIVFRGLTLALNSRGHELVVVTTDPINNNDLKNYTEIDISYLYAINRNFHTSHDASWLEKFPKLAVSMNVHTEKIFDHPELKKIYAPDSNEKFDLILLEWIYWPAFFFLGTRFNAPVIGMSPMGLTTNVHYSLGNPILTSHQSNWDLYPSPEPSFYERIKNWIIYWKGMHYYRTVHVPSQEEIVRKYYKGEIPDLNELEKNVSLVFVNQQPVISYVRANVPKIVPISGFHVLKHIKPLPEELKKILDEAKEGFVYMSLGSNMKSTMLSKKELNEFITAFSRLPYKVLWKYEDDVLPGKPNNVHIGKWLPQQGVLAHPNLKAFVYQGGLQSTEEAILNTVPLVGIPTWADQRMLIDKMVYLGVAEKLSLSTINSRDLEKAIRTVVLDKSYKENMLYLRTLLKDNSHDLLDNAMWWTEHVIRHNGTRHLDSSTADEPWYRRQDMDIIAFMSAASTIALGIISFICYKLLTIVINTSKTSENVRIKKLN